MFVDINGTWVNSEDMGFRIHWEDEEKGFGQLDFIKLKVNGKIIINNECMSKEYMKKVLCTLVDNAELIDE